LKKKQSFQVYFECSKNKGEMENVLYSNRELLLFYFYFFFGLLSSKTGKLSSLYKYIKMVIHFLLLFGFDLRSAFSLSLSAFMQYDATLKQLLSIFNNGS